VKLVVPPSTHKIYGPGRRCTTAAAGDIVLVRHSGLVARVIRFFERLRRPARQRMGWRQWWRYCWTNHAAVVLSGGPSAVVAQATARGIVVSPLSAFTGTTYAVVKAQCVDEQRTSAVAFARAAVGSGYGWAQIPADAFNALTGLELSLGVGDRMVCSTAAARAAERMGLIPDRPPDAVTPAHLAWYFGVQAGS